MTSIAQAVTTNGIVVSSTASLIDRFIATRGSTEALCRPLEIEDFTIQTIPDVSPIKWHIAHTTWFFENFLLIPYLKNYQPYHPQFGYLFNSYYETVGSFLPRPERGLLSRPTVADIMAYRRHIDDAMQSLLAQTHAATSAEIRRRCEIGIHHEQQHQELMLTDIKNVFAFNPLRPRYLDHFAPAASSLSLLRWLAQPGGLVQIGYDGNGFCYDNELPAHRQWLEPFALASRLISNGEYLEFMQDGAYSRPELWLADGWHTLKQQRWQAPLYWEYRDDEWQIMTLAGLQSLDRSAPVCHVSYYEADAYARWAGQRLPNEAEWECVARHYPVAGNLRESGYLQPIAAPQEQGDAVSQLYGDAWEWTSSAYQPYPGFQPAAGSLGEYNGKFMCNQLVLRGGSCVTPHGHIRSSYRNFFYPRDRWQFSGIRLARSN